MSSGSGSNGDTTATDIITYIGIPLAVLGVLPIMYNTVTTLITLSKVRRILRKSRLSGLTRGDVVNHVIEVELPRFTIAPLDREEHSAEYWSTFDHPSLISGGTWTSFNWKMHTIGLKTQRIEYADQLRQPQAEIGFEELISYLLDLGAVPHAAGFRMLRTSGLWIPTGTALLLSPDRHEGVLTIAPLNDSDGHLSLAVRWSRQWNMRSKSSLPPYWIRVVATKASQYLQDEPSEEQTATMSDKDSIEEAPADPKKVLLPSEKPLAEITTASVRCHISIDGLVSAMTEDADSIPEKYLNIEHLFIRPNSSAGVWFASAATALGAATMQSALWNYHIPEALLTFSRADTIPCGVLVELGVVEESDTPEWATKYDDEAHEAELRMRQQRDRMNNMMAESRMSESQRAAAWRDRVMRENNEWNDARRDRERRDVQRAEVRMTEALQSPRWGSKLVAENSLKWLKKNCPHVEQTFDVQTCVQNLLVRMLRDLDFTKALANMLDEWKGWVDNGGMKKVDFVMLKDKDKHEMFSYASLIMLVIRDSMSAVDGSLAMDLQESIRTWKKVRLG